MVKITEYMCSICTMHLYTHHVATVSLDCGLHSMLILHAECREAGKPVTHECVQDERTGLWGPTEDRGEGAERRPSTRSSLPLKG